MNVLATHSLRTDSKIGLDKMEELLNTVLAELQSQAMKVQMLEQQARPPRMAAARTPFAPSARVSAHA